MLDTLQSTGIVRRGPLLTFSEVQITQQPPPPLPHGTFVNGASPFVPMQMPPPPRFVKNAGSATSISYLARPPAPVVFYGQGLHRPLNNLSGKTTAEGAALFRSSIGGSTANFDGHLIDAKQLVSELSETVARAKRSAPDRMSLNGGHLQSGEVGIMIGVYERLKRLSEDKRSLALVKILQVVHEIEFGTSA